MRKAIAIDLDGTLLDSSRIAAPHSLTMVERAADCGWVVIISTARPVRTIKLAVPEEFIRFYWAACNGAWILKDGQIIKRQEIPYQTVAHLIRLFSEYNLRFYVEAEDTFFSHCEKPARFIGEYYDLDQLGSVDACKVIVDAQSNDEISTVASLIPPSCSYVVTDDNSLIQIAHADCSKLYAAKHILEREGITLTDTIAFGDDNNDISLLKAAGCGVAMGNATEELKRVADHITATNDEDGVGLFLEQVLANGLLHLTDEEDRSNGYDR